MAGFYNAGRATGHAGRATVSVAGAIPVGGAWRKALAAAEREGAPGPPGDG